MKRISIFLALAASALHAAIITEQNDLYLYLPDYATFRGTSAAPGINSCWIPYGTYTGGSGGTEYTRVTSNLVGVVFSAYDGLIERDYYPEKYAWNLYWHDHYPSNSTMRVFDWLNRGRYGEDRPIEHWLARVEAENDEWWQQGDGTNLYHRGVMSTYGSRKLDALVGEAPIPILTSWSETLPFRAADSNAWANVFPGFSALKFDTNIWPAETNETVNPVYERPWLGDLRWPGAWLYPSDWGVVGGQDYYDSAQALAHVMMRIPLSHTIKDVLSGDTGWNDNDYAHWSNATTRLDWKRLGIICQFERQAEITTDNCSQGYLPFISSEATRNKGYEAEYTIPSITIPPEGPGSVLATISTSDIEWSLATNHVTNVVSVIGTCHPTARIIPPTLHGDISPAFRRSTELYLPDAKLEDLIIDGLNLAVGGDLEGMNATLDVYTYYGEIECEGNIVTMSMLDVVVMDVDEPYSPWITYDGPCTTINATGTSASNAVVRLRQGLTKRAASAYTRCEPSERAGVISNMVERGGFTPSKDRWASNVVARVEMPTWEIMLDALGSGVFDLASSHDANETSMAWDDLVNRRSTSDCACTRQFRRSPTSIRGTSFSALTESWLNALVNLDIAVKDRMMAVGGVNVVAAASQRATISSSEEERLYDNFAKTLGVSYNLIPVPAGRISLGANVDVVDGSPVSVDIYTFEWEDAHDGSWHSFSHTDEGWHVADISLSVESTSASLDLSADNPPARVDAHQSSMSRTLWRFKNLRDPNL